MAAAARIVPARPPEINPTWLTGTRLTLHRIPTPVRMKFYGHNLDGIYILSALCDDRDLYTSQSMNYCHTKASELTVSGTTRWCCLLTQSHATFTSLLSFHHLFSLGFVDGFLLPPPPAANPPGFVLSCPLALHAHGSAE